MKNLGSAPLRFSLITLMLLAVAGVSVSRAARVDVEAFVVRFYEQCLNRDPDQVGLNNWVNALMAGTQTGADVAQGFILSPEFISRNTRDDQFLTILYRAFFGREPDSAGYTGWLSALAAPDVTRNQVLAGFIGAPEFAALCSQYGIVQYTRSQPVEDFIARLYRICLEREPDPAGLQNWFDALSNGSLTYADVARGFVFSPEFIGRNLSDEQFVIEMYRAFFGREPDSAGLNAWLDQLANQATRADVLDGFLGSPEFANLLPSQAVTSATLLAFNDLGMHCIDREFSVFSILPPFNVVHAQVLTRDSSTGFPRLLTDADVSVSYSPIADPLGSINSYSIGKTDFWQYADALFGANLQPGEGLTGLFMPQDQPDSPGLQPMEFNGIFDWFSAEGLPITPLNDHFDTNPYSLMRITANDYVSGTPAAHLDVVVPVAAETDCQFCHKTGGMAALGTGPGTGWAVDADLEVQAKKNILKLHDQSQGTQIEASQPVLCAGCHYSPALDLAGTGPAGEQIGKPNFSSVMHAFHGQLAVFQTAATVDDSCYQCHPGKITQCQRGAMKTGGMDCFDCHGDMSAVGGIPDLQAGGSLDGTNDGAPRRPWKDLPRCQACHTGDAVDHLEGSDLVLAAAGIRLTQAYRLGDSSASPLQATNRRFAENVDTLFRNSRGHGDIACEGCHGSTHAIWPAGTNDNVAAQTLQGHAGTIIECGTCHAAGSLPLTIDGPHGLHNVNEARWVDERHGEFFEHNSNNCRACHGLNLTGSPLSKTPVARSFAVEHNGIVNLVAGQQVGCNLCHGLPGGNSD